MELVQLERWTEANELFCYSEFHQKDRQAGYRNTGKTHYLYTWCSGGGGVGVGVSIMKGVLTGERGVNR